MQLDIKKYFSPFFLLLIISCLFVFCLHLYIISHDPNIGDEDAAAYALQAKSIKNGDGLSSQVVWLFIKEYNSVKHSEDYWPPLQSFIIAASTAIFGESLFGIKLPNVLIFLMLIILVYKIGYSLFSQKVGILSALMCLFAPDLNLYSISCRNEMPYIFLITLAFFYMAKTHQKNNISYKYLALSAIITGVAFLQRPIALFLIISFPMWFALRYFICDHNKLSINNVKRSGFAMSIFIAIFLFMVAPYIVRNIIKFNKPLPSLPFNLSAIYLNSYKHDPGRRTIDSDLSHYKEMHFVYYGNEPSIDYTSSKELACVVKKFVHEIRILFLMFKRSYINQLSLFFLALISYFIITGTAINYLGLFIIYLLLNILFIPLHQHVEQRYFVFIIPVIGLFSSYMLLFFEDIIAANSNQMKNKLNCITKYRIFIFAFLAVSFLMPNIFFYNNCIKKFQANKETIVIYKWLNYHTPVNAVLMSGQPYRTSYYADRPCIQVPIGRSETIWSIITHFKVTHLLLATNKYSPAELLQINQVVLRHFSVIKKIGATTIYARRQLIFGNAKQRFSGS